MLDDPSLPLALSFNILSDKLVCMIRIRFTDRDSKKRALGRLAGRYPFKSWVTGEMLVPESALAYLATKGMPFQVEGPAT
ncbi:MAG: hypothetical protein ACHRXM_34990 [Isosphaerales bacterium]